jgi:hypothetical protein
VSGLEDNAKGNFVMRKERVLCVAYNTIRLHDYALADEICKLTDADTSFVNKIFYVLNRQEKKMFPNSEISDEVYISLEKAIFTNNYDDIPATMVARAIYELSNQPFTETVWILHNDYGGDTYSSEQMYENASYDGSIEQLEEFILEHKITAMFIDSIDTVKLLKDRGNIPFTGMSFMISKLGYNYTGEIDEDNKHVMKHIDLITSSKSSSVENFEISFIHLWEFDEAQTAELECEG